jgi:hypothetical protein
VFKVAGDIVNHELLEYIRKPVDIEPLLNWDVFIFHDPETCAMIARIRSMPAPMNDIYLQQILYH